jgi:hypothetical protein
MSGETNAGRSGRWIEANQRVLVAEFARLEAQLAGEDTTAARQVIEEAGAVLPSPAAIDELTAAFGLSAFERDVLLLCAGVEMNAGLAARCAAVDGEGSRPFATFGLALAALQDPHWSAVTPVGPLRLWRLLDVKDEHALTTSRLVVDERVLHYLAGVNYLDPRLRPLLRARTAPFAMADSHAGVVDAVVEAFQAAGPDLSPIVQLVGDDSSGQEDVAFLAATRLGLQLLILRAADIPAGLHEADALSVLWHRESALLPSALLVLVERDDEASRTVRRWIERAGGVTLIAAPEPLALDRPDRRLTIARPEAPEQKQIWARAFGPAAATLNGALDGVAAQFRLSAATIVRTASRLRPAMESPGQEAALWHACRAAVRGGLDALAQRVEPVATWPQLILPDAQVATLRQIATHVRQRLTVYDEWGFAGAGGRGLGITALFSGESGTGKTMAAEVLANELRLDLYRIDLAATVSKYIGETEKNLRRLFDAAEASGAILLFDEADALFGRRSEIKDSHDRYANIEVSYLLQRMEAYRGLAILTTNFETALDPAFQRRLRFSVQFPFPDPAQRERIWRGVFPAAAPLEQVDPVRLARLNVAGGSIRNIALHAAFLAAEARTPIGMGHLLRAARSEAAKRDRPCSEAETRGWV